MSDPPFDSLPPAAVRLPLAMMPRTVINTDPPNSGQAEIIGALMSSAARMEKRVELLTEAIGRMRTDVDTDRGAQIDRSSSKAAASSSNRLAALMTVLFTAYEIAAPFIEQIRGHFTK